MTEIWLAFLAGLAGSMHCVGMCGPLAAALALRSGDSAVSRVAPQLLYNAGRVCTYVLLGITVGTAGELFSLTALREAGLWVFAGANLFVIAAGLGSFLRFPGFSLFSLEAGGDAAFRLAGLAGGRGGAFTLGVALGFLPCGLVYAPLMSAASAGPIKGAAMMAALGAGTFPALFLFGAASTSLAASFRERAVRGAGLFIALVGAAGLWRALGKIGVAPPFPF